MAKKKIQSKDAAMAASDCYFSPTTYLDFDDVAEVKGVSVGDKVTVVIRGTVKSVEQRERYEGESQKAQVTSSICLKDFEAEIDKTGAFDELLDEDD